jgi:hypothetical protein
MRVRCAQTSSVHGDRRADSDIASRSSPLYQRLSEAGGTDRSRTSSTSKPPPSPAIAFRCDCLLRFSVTFSC